MGPINCECVAYRPCAWHTAFEKAYNVWNYMLGRAIEHANKMTGQSIEY